MQKIYVYADETGQDTLGELFLVAIVISDKDDVENLENILLKLEDQAGKKKKKWGRLNTKEKISFIQAVLKIKKLRKSIFYSRYQSSKQYTQLTALSLAKAILAKMQNNENYKARIFIDGLQGKESNVVREEIKKLRIRYHSLKGLAHRKSAFIRLADAIAGFLRDCYESQGYCAKEFARIKKLKKIIEV